MDGKFGLSFDQGEHVPTRVEYEHIFRRIGFTMESDSIRRRIEIIGKSSLSSFIPMVDWMDHQSHKSFWIWPHHLHLAQFR